MTLVFLPRASGRARRQSARPRANWFALLLGGVVAVGLGGLRHASAAPATAPAKGPADTAPPDSPEGVRTFRDVQMEIEQTGQKLGQDLPGVEALFDPAKRNEVKPKVLPLLKKLADLFDEAVVLQPLAEGALAKAKMEVTAMRAILDDPDAGVLLRKMAVSTDSEQATSATAWEVVVAFARAGKDADGQKKAIEHLDKLASAHPDNDMIAQSAYLMSQSAATPELAEKATHIVTDVLKGPLAERMGAQMAAERKLRALENKPLTVAGTTVGGKPFSTAEWKGKVVVVDFWATWCVTCLQELPHLKKVYDQYHAKGLEVVSVSSDTDKDDLKNFLTANPEMTWPQLFDDHAAAATKLHPLAQEYGILEMPTVLLIDKKGVVRAVAKNQKQMDEWVAKLVEEKP